MVTRLVVADGPERATCTITYPDGSSVGASCYEKDAGDCLNDIEGIPPTGPTPDRVEPITILVSDDGQNTTLNIKIPKTKMGSRFKLHQYSKESETGCKGG